MFKEGYYRYNEIFKKYFGEKIVIAKEVDGNIQVVFNDGSVQNIDKKYFNQMYNYAGSIRKEF